MTDIAIIGGGIAGLSAAASLAPHASVTLLEAEATLGHHASGRSAAMFLEDYGNATVRALNRASATALAPVLSPRGMLLLGRSSDSEHFSAEAKAFAMTHLSPSEATAHLPILSTTSVRHAAIRVDAPSIDTDALLQDARRTARANGATLHLSARVRSLEHHDGRWHLGWAGGALTAPMVVNAAGAWADTVAQLAGLKPIGLVPYRRSMASLPPPEGRNVQSWPFTLATGDRWYAKPAGGAWNVSPSEADASHPHDAWADEMVLAEGLARYQEMVTSPVTRVTARWAGLRTFAPDSTLVLGPDARAPSFLWCAGQGGYGFQTAPAAADLIADHALGRAPTLDPETVAALSPDRFTQV